MSGTATEHCCPQASPPPGAGGNQRLHIHLALLAVAMLFGTGVLILNLSAFATSNENSTRELEKTVHDLRMQVLQLKQDHGVAPAVLNRYRGSVGYIYGIYRVGLRGHPSEIRRALSGTGFLVGGGLVVTNRHVAEPWYGDADAKSLIERGATAAVERLVIFFPGSPTPVRLLHPILSRTSDLALLRADNPDAVRKLAVLPLAEAPGPVGQLITVMGYPLGIPGMVAKSPPDIVERLAYRHADIETATKLASLSLIRPSTTFGHLGDVVGDKIVYDAPTTHGGSGGPVLNSKGEVIGVNFAYMDGFSGCTLGVSVESLHSLLQAAKQNR